MPRRPPISQRSYTLLPYTTLCRAFREARHHSVTMLRHTPQHIIGDAHVERPPRLACKDVHPIRQAPYPNMSSRARAARPGTHTLPQRSEEHTSALQSLMRISYAVFCLQKHKYTYK